MKRTFAVAALFTALAAVDSQAKAQDFCTTYAKNAVEQVRLMMSHSGCHVAPVFRWTPSYQNQYNACRISPKVFLEHEQSARDTWLRSCGAITAAAPADAAPAAPVAAPAVPVAATPAAPVSAPAASPAVAGAPRTSFPSLPTSYNVMEVTQVDGKYFTPRALNRSGAIGGEGGVVKGPQAERHAMVFDGKSLHDLNDDGPGPDVPASLPPGFQVASSVVGINAGGWVAGRTLLGGLPYFYDGHVHLIADAQRDSGLAEAVNANRQVVGFMFTGVGNNFLQPGGLEQAFVYDGSLHYFGFPAGATSEAVAINDAGVVAGIVKDPRTGGRQQSFRYHDGTQVFDGLTPGSWSHALIIDEHGTIYGFAGGGDAYTHGFAYDGAIHDLGAIARDRVSARAINESGIMIGQWQTGPEGPLHAFVATGKDFADLNQRLRGAPDGVVLEDVAAINASGQVLAISAGRPRYFLLTPSEGAPSRKVKVCVVPSGPPGGTAAKITHADGVVTLTFTGVCGAAHRFTVERPTIMSGMPSADPTAGSWVYAAPDRQSGIMFNVTAHGDVGASPLLGPQLQMVLGR